MVIAAAATEGDSAASMTPSATADDFPTFTVICCGNKVYYLYYIYTSAYDFDISDDLGSGISKSSIT